nr:DUF262 domain-containing protein [Paenalcaligenes hominis]
MAETTEKEKSMESQIIEYSKKIDFYTSEYTIEILAQKMHEYEYTVPEYQREFTWDEVRKSKFIESIIIGLPIPFLFLWISPETGKLEIVDGSQRLRTLEEYLYNRLSLVGLDRLHLLNNTRFEDLTLSRQRKILNKSIRGVILSEDTDVEARIDLFERINTGSKVANPTEIRRGVLRGDFMDLVTSLAQDERFKTLAPVSIKQEKEREREELVSRFFAYTDGLDDYRDDVSPFLFRYIKNKSEEVNGKPRLIKRYEKRFNKMLDFVEANLPMGFRKTEKSNTTPRTRFESIAIGSYLALEENPRLSIGPEDVSAILASREFTKIIRTDGANSRKNLTGRIEFMKEALLEKGAGQ